MICSPCLCRPGAENTQLTLSAPSKSKPRFVCLDSAAHVGLSGGTPSAKRKCARSLWKREGASILGSANAGKSWSHSAPPVVQSARYSPGDPTTTRRCVSKTSTMSLALRTPSRAPANGGEIRLRTRLRGGRQPHVAGIQPREELSGRAAKMVCRASFKSSSGIE